MTPKEFHTRPATSRSRPRLKRSFGSGIKKSEPPLKKFFNTSGLLNKEKHLKEKLPLLSKDETLALLAEDGMLVKRPMLIGDDFVLVGFKETDWEKALK